MIEDPTKKVQQQSNVKNVVESGGDQQNETKKSDHQIVGVQPNQKDKQEFFSANPKVLQLNKDKVP